jgi:hypothetical protein
MEKGKGVKLLQCIRPLVIMGLSEAVKFPSIVLILLSTGLDRRGRGSVRFTGWHKLCSEFLTQSQLVVLLLQFRRLEQTTNFGPTVMLRLLGISFLLFLLEEI